MKRTDRNDVGISEEHRGAASMLFKASNCRNELFSPAKYF